MRGGRGWCLFHANRYICTSCTQHAGRETSWHAILLLQRGQSTEAQYPYCMLHGSFNSSAPVLHIPCHWTFVFR